MKNTTVFITTKQRHLYKNWDLGLRASEAGKICFILINIQSGFYGIVLTWFHESKSKYLMFGGISSLPFGENDSKYVGRLG